MQKIDPLIPKKAEVDNFFVSWSDLLALLLCLFAYIISISTIDQSKLSLANDSFKNSLSVLETKVIKPTDFDLLYQLLKKKVMDENLQDVVSLRKEPEMIIIQLGQEMLFSSGSAVLSRRSERLLNILSTEFKKKIYFISIEGHTDNIPIRSKLFHSNWDLSSTRAVSVTEFLIKSGVNPTRMRAIGYSDTQPLVNNDTLINRKKNRRVTLIVEKAFSRRMT